MKNKLLGSIVLITGTCVGGGMLALPLITAELTFWQSFFVLFIAWLLPTLACLALVDILIKMPKGTNLVSLSQIYLGNSGKLITYFMFLALMYSLVSAYFSTSLDVLETVLQAFHLEIAQQIISVLFLPVLLLILHRGTATVDVTTRVLMLIKAGAFLLAVCLLLPVLHWQQLLLQLPKLKTWFSHLTWGLFAVAFTSFGYLIILPTVVDYLKRDRRSIIWAVLIGSLLPLVVYFLWIIAIQGSISKIILLKVLHAAHTQSAFLQEINHLKLNLWVADAIRIFTSVSVFTSLLGVSLALCHFLQDGFSQQKIKVSSIVIYSLAFLPPIIIGMIYPAIFIAALSYAGIIIVLSHILLPFLIWISYKKLGH